MGVRQSAGAASWGLQGGGEEEPGGEDPGGAEVPGEERRGAPGQLCAEARVLCEGQRCESPALLPWARAPRACQSGKSVERALFHCHESAKL